MPDSYTHCHLATRALMRSGQVVSSHPAFMAGANGPDPLFHYQFYKRKKSPDLPGLAGRVHTESTGQFLNALIQLAVTPVQQSFALGYLTHYAADCILNPYIHAMTRKGMPYGMGKGKLHMRAALDSTLYYQNHRTYTVPLHAGTPILIGDDLAQVTALWHEVVRKVYGASVPVVAFADAYHDNTRFCKLLYTPRGAKRLAAPLLERVLLGSRGVGELRAQMQPAQPLRYLPAAWDNPYTGETLNQTLEEILNDAQEASAVCITGAMRFWMGKLTAEQLEQVLGNNSYYTGQPAVPVRGSAAAPEDKTPAKTKAEPPKPSQ